MEGLTMTQIEVKLKADVNKIVNLYEGEALSENECKELLGQFNKEDLISELLDIEDNENEEVEEVEEPQEEEIEEVEEPKEEEIEVLEEDDLPVSDDDFDNLLD